MEQEIKDYKARVVEKKEVALGVYRTGLEIMEDKKISFLPGQFVSVDIGEVTLPDGTKANQRRSYSLCSFPTKNASYIEFVVDTAPMGFGSKFFLQLAVGDGVLFKGPLGKFVLDKREASRDYVFIATGTGVGPFMGMMPFLLADKIENRVALFFGLRYETEIFFDEIFESWRTKNPNFSYKICISKPTETWEGLTGHVTEHVLSEMGSFSNPVFYLCGNKAMISEMRRTLVEKGAAEGDVRFEQYY
jgi:NAD(P)H-flavin reductase